MSRGVESKQFPYTREKEETFQVSNDRAVGLKTQLVPFVFSFPSLSHPFLSSFFTQSLGRLGKVEGEGHGVRKVMLEKG